MTSGSYADTGARNWIAFLETRLQTHECELAVLQNDLSRSETGFKNSTNCIERLVVFPLESHCHSKTNA
jgi:hypothetical protein